MGAATVMAGAGVIFAVILYNATSAVSSCNIRLFVKMAPTLNFLLAVNDCNIWPIALMLVAVIVALHRCASASSDYFASGVAWTITVCFVISWFAGILGPGPKGAIFCTQGACFGGLLGDQPVANDDWVINASPAECASKISGIASALQAQGHAAAMMDMYRAMHPKSPERSCECIEGDTNKS
eukprot:gnl/MRDRNA2_/MRDRNA2_207773_c0_seq1.p1 gnl/MRDRNA2_/MRDRNA2_207773_c0~~gnl/MRDRNA2_/MRDRNA2_207773_c0_seq1.p1  ORF type:complete len:205 (-),score=26.11 gnl/MRDRNA2_/MRDRNA2_207773_c0_seq1:50-598(-)